jgi:ribosomal protein S25
MTNIQGNQTPVKQQKMLKKIQELIHEDRRQTTHELADNAGISYRVCQEILRENFNMRRIAAKFVPRLLINDQKQRHINVCLEL